MAKSNLYFFFGPDSYTSTKKVLAWKKKFNEKFGGDFNISHIRNKKFTLQDFRNETESLPFAAEKRLVVIESFLAEGNKDEQKKVADQLTKIADHSVVIFLETTNPDKRTSLYKKLKKTATCEEYKALEDFALNKWISTRVQQEGGQIEPQATTLLAAFIGSNLWKLEQEIKKLTLYKESAPITADDIRTLCNQSFEESIFTLTDAISNKHTQKSISSFQKIVDSGEDVPRVFYMLIRQFRILLQIKELVQRGTPAPEIKEITKLHPFVIKNCSRQSRNFTIPQLKKIYRQLLLIEIAIKSGKVKMLKDDQRDLIMEIEKLIISSSA